MKKANKIVNSNPTKCKPKKGQKPIVIKEKEEDIMVTELKGDPDNFKQAVNKEAQKGQATRVMVPVFFFLILGTVVGLATWYYQRNSQQNMTKSVEEKIQTPPVISDDEAKKETEEKVEEKPQETPQVTPSVSGYTEYAVKEGDTLSGIANANNMTSAELAKLNNITNPESLKIGQILKIPKQ